MDPFSIRPWNTAPRRAREGGAVVGPGWSWLKLVDFKSCIVVIIMIRHGCLIGWVSFFVGSLAMAGWWAGWVVDWWLVGCWFFRKGYDFRTSLSKHNEDVPQQTAERSGGWLQVVSSSVVDLQEAMSYSCKAFGTDPLHGCASPLSVTACYYAYRGYKTLEIHLLGVDVPPSCIPSCTSK